MCIIWWPIWIGNMSTGYFREYRNKKTGHTERKMLIITCQRDIFENIEIGNKIMWLNSLISFWYYVHIVQRMQKCI